LLLVTVGLIIAADTPQETTQKEKQKLQGAWAMISREVSGKKTDKEKLEGGRWTFDGDKIKITYQGKDEQASYVLDPSKDPKTIDLNSSETKRKAFGIYKFDGDILTVAYSLDERPKDWVTKKGDKGIVLVLKRAKK
jgi:uncharacterized protein (TIGR03067 family)